MTDSRKKGELSATCKAYLIEWVKGIMFGSRKEFSNKFTEKGLLVENEAIEFASEVLGWGFVVKNETRLNNNYLTGEADIVLAGKIADIKSSWDEYTFPMFEEDIPTKGYDWQLQGYMALYDKPEAQLVYCLMDAPEQIVEKVTRQKAYELGGEITEELYQEVKTRLTFSNQPDSYRIKTFEIKRDESKIQAIYDRINECRAWIKSNIEPIVYQLNNHGAINNL